MYKLEKEDYLFISDTRATYTFRTQKYYQTSPLSEKCKQATANKMFQMGLVL